MPVLVIWPWILKNFEPGEKIFPQITYTDALKVLKQGAQKNGVNLKEYPIGAHSTRHGATEAMQEADGALYELLEAGNWSSAAFKTYLDAERLRERGLAAVAKLDLEKLVGRPFEGSDDES